jgi:hypothetical protein
LAFLAAFLEPGVDGWSMYNDRQNASGLPIVRNIMTIVIGRDQRIIAIADRRV